MYRDWSTKDEKVRGDEGAAFSATFFSGSSYGLNPDGEWEKELVYDELNR